MICVVSGATTMHANLTVTSASVKQIPTTDRFKDYSTGRNTTVRRRPGLNRITWKTPSSRAFISLQEPVAVLASYVPQANAGMKQYECGRTQPLFHVGHDHGINKRSKPKGLRQY